MVSKLIDEQHRKRKGRENFELNKQVADAFVQVLGGENLGRHCPVCASAYNFQDEMSIRL